MENIDLKDRKILYHLNENSRESFRSIGKKVGLSKDVVTSRVKKMQEKGIIQGFYIHFNHLALGYTPLRFYFKFQYITAEIKNEIIKHFINYGPATVVNELEGNFDLIVLMLVEHITDIYSFWQETLDKYGDYFANIEYSNYWGEVMYPLSFLLDTKDDRKDPVKRFWKKNIDHDETDLKILKILSINARISTIELANKLKLNSVTVNNRIKKLKQVGLLLGFTLKMDWKKLGYQMFKIDFFLKEYSKKNSIIKYIEKNPNLSAVDHTLGYADLELEIFFKNVDELRRFIEDISIKFPKTIKNYTYFMVMKNHKFFILK
jgi:Lrp/AsnC family transcriptional regulator for asnA, asnC and gidA